MSVFRKSLTLSMSLALVLSSFPVASFAEDTRSSSKESKPEVKRSKYGYNPFCNEEAGKLMEELNDANEPKMKRLNELKADIEDVTARADILNAMTSFKDKYQQGLSQIVASETEKGKAQTLNKKMANLDNMKKVIRNGLIINAVGLLLKSGKMDKDGQLEDDAFTISSLCSKSSGNDQQPVCKKETIGSWLGFNPLNKTLDNFKQAYSHVAQNNQGQLKADVQKIIDSIPSDIAPEAIFKILDTTSPGLTSILKSTSGETARDTLKKCLDEKSTPETLGACEQLLPAVGKQQNFLQAMNTQTSAAVAGIKNLAPIIEESAKKNLESLNREMKKYTLYTQTPAEKALTNFANIKPDILKLNQMSNATSNIIRQANRNKIKSASVLLPGLAQLFYVEPNRANLNSAEETEDIHDKAMAAAEEKAQFWENNCSPPKESQINVCLDQLNIIEPQLNAKKANLKLRLENLQNQMSQISLNGDGSFSKIETLKEYIAEKYLRTCKNNPDIKLNTETIGFAVSVGGECYASSQKISTLDTLSGDMNNIFANTKFATKIKQGRTGSSTFDDNELKKFSDVCSGELNSNFGQVCKMISNETKVYKEKVNKEENIEKESKDYWLAADGNGGYTRTAKKSAMRIIGEGALPVIPQMLPMYFANFGMKQNINTLTSQALYQKQMLYNFSVYNNSPWMYNFNYFGNGTVYPAYGTTTTTTGLTNNAGFGF